MSQNQYRQGDVYLVPVSESEFDTSNMAKAKRPTVALGEATGHHHTFEGDVVVYEEKSDLAINERGMLVDVREDAVLTHQEHAPIQVPKGKYRRVIQMEYSPAEIRNVAD